MLENNIIDWEEDIESLDHETHWNVLHPGPNDEYMALITHLLTESTLDFLAYSFRDYPMQGRRRTVSYSAYSAALGYLFGSGGVLEEHCTYLAIDTADRLRTRLTHLVNNPSEGFLILLNAEQKERKNDTSEIPESKSLPPTPPSTKRFSYGKGLGSTE